MGLRLMYAMQLLLSILAASVESKAAPLRIAVPLKHRGFRQIVSVGFGGNPTGFVVEVFARCMAGLGYDIEYHALELSNYDEMISRVVNKEYDGIVADLTVTGDRILKVDFTQPYAQSALVLLAPFRYGSSAQLWDFLQPFSTHLWLAILALFFATALAMWVVERRNPGFDIHNASWAARVSEVFWFTAMSVFLAQRSEISTKLGRILTVTWLVVVLILTITYTASLTSILTTQGNFPTVPSFQFLKDSSLHVGYQGSGIYMPYLLSVGINRSRLVSLDSEDDYQAALDSGRVAAIVDESPYIQAFLGSRSCRYTVVDSEIAFLGGFAFAFQKNSSLTSQVSAQLLALEEAGEVQRIKSRWLPTDTSKCASQYQMQFRNVGGPFLLIAALYAVALFYRLLESYCDGRASSRCWWRRNSRMTSIIRPGEDLDPCVELCNNTSCAQKR